MEVDAKEAEDVTLVFKSEVIPEVLELSHVFFNETVVRAEPDLIITVVENHNLQGRVDK